VGRGPATAADEVYARLNAGERGPSLPGVQASSRSEAFCPYLTQSVGQRVSVEKLPGGCWNDNDRDDSPNDPKEDPATGGEGGDCSGFTFKVWRESLDSSNAGFYQWGLLRNVHGPYSASAFKAGTGAPNVTVSKASLIPMDALASDGHIGLLYATNPDGTDQIIEAKGEDYGTNIWTRAYRGSSSYSGVRRTGWS
jgi:hypothetical protein